MRIAIELLSVAVIVALLGFTLLDVIREPESVPTVLEPPMHLQDAVWLMDNGYDLDDETLKALSEWIEAHPEEWNEWSFKNPKK